MRFAGKRIVKLLAAFGCGLVLAACGGGGGGNDGPAVPSGYTGTTTQAVISADNALAIALEAYDGGGLSDVPFVVPMSAGGAAARPGVTKIAEALAEAVKETGLGEPRVSPAATTETDTVDGGCGGNATYTVTVNDAGTSFKGTMNFNSYCSDGMTMSGQVKFSGSVSQSSEAFSITFESLTVTADGETVTISGTVSVKANNTSGTLSMSLVLTDAANKTYYYKYSFTVTEGGNYDEITLSGRVYHHDFGYVIITTEQPVREYWAAMYPSSGVLRFAGANGTWATLTFTGGGNYRIDCSDGTVITGMLQ